MKILEVPKRQTFWLFVALCLFGSGAKVLALLSLFVCLPDGTKQRPSTVYQVVVPLVNPVVPSPPPHGHTCWRGGAFLYFIGDEMEDSYADAILGVIIAGVICFMAPLGTLALVFYAPGWVFSALSWVFSAPIWVGASLGVGLLLGAVKVWRTIVSQIAQKIK
jgi:hypothetical protein